MTDEQMAAETVLVARRVLRGETFSPLKSGVVLLRGFNAISQRLERYLSSNELTEIHLANDVIDVLCAFGCVTDERLDPNYFILGDYDERHAKK